MIDRYHRAINYLRLSVTDRCNLRCIYCMPEEGITFVNHKEILTYEEMLHIVHLCVQKGIRKVRVTGGEPLLRKGILRFLEQLSRVEGLAEISLTTNGVLLQQFAQDLRRCGIHRINVSLDTLKPERFLQITRKNLFDQVWQGIEAAMTARLHPVKINVVAMQGINDDEILDFVRLTEKKALHVRFIEKMPLGATDSSVQEYLSTSKILQIIGQYGKLRPLNNSALDGPAQRYALTGAKGEIGFIGAMSHQFCDTCNRLRLTANGRLRGCLFSDQEIDIKSPLRDGKDDATLSSLISHAILTKPNRHHVTFDQPRKCVRPMNSIGG